jgi:hypothetical protein
MFGTLRRHPLLVLSQAARDPLDTLAALQEVFYSRFESANTIGYIADAEWEDALHRRLGMSSESLVEGFGRYGLPLWRPYGHRAWRLAPSASTDGMTGMPVSSGPSGV